MIKDLVNIIKDVCLRHKGVCTFRYQSNIYNNAQNNYKPFQVYLDDVSYHNLNITTNIFTAEFNMYILSQPSKDKDGILEVQDAAYTIAADIVAYLDYNYRGVMNMHDYAIMTLSHYSDDDSAGVRLSITLEVPSPVNLCDLDDNFNDEPYEEEPDAEITVDIKPLPELSDIKKITLPKGCSRNCR